MDNQENQIEPITNKTSPALWVSIILVIIVLAVGSYFLFIQDDTINTNNVNTSVNTNTTINENTNTAVNTTTPSNTNSVVDTINWETYTNDQLNFTLKHPNTWKAETVTTEILDSEINDTILSKGACGDEGCAIGIDVCEISISNEPDIGDSIITNMNSWVESQPYFKGDKITDVTLGEYDAVQTNIAVTPFSNGSQGMGLYFLISTNNSDSFISSTLSKGFNNDECKIEMFEILNTITQ